MGLFKTNTKEKTELEKFIEILPTIYLVSDEDVVKEIIEYASDIKNGKISNQFTDERTLTSVLIKYADTNIASKKQTILDFILQVKNVLNTIYVSGIYDEDLSLVLNIFNKNGIYESDLFDINLYRIFDNSLEYLTTMNIFLENNEAKNSFDKIRTFLIDIRSTFTSPESFYFYTLSFMNKITIGTDIDKLIKEERARIDKKEGIYDLDETTLDLIYEKTLSSEGFLSRLESLVLKADTISKSFNTKLETYKTRLTEMNLDSLKEYKTSLEKDLEKLKKIIEESKQELDEYALTKRHEITEALLREKTDITSSLITERDRIITSLKKFEETLTTLALTQTSEITRIGREQISQIDSCLTNAPHIKEILSDMTGFVKDKDLLENLVELSKLDLKNLTSSQVITSESKLVVPSPNIIIPEEIDSTINRYFDERRSYKTRLEEIKEKMQKNTEERGIIYHKKTLKIIKYILHGLVPYLYGPSGGGKSKAVELIADLLDISLTKINYINEEYQVTGAEPFLNNFTPSMIHQTFKYGGLAFADEFDNGNSRATVIVNPFLRRETQEYTFSNHETVKRHPNFRMIIAGNTDGMGPTKTHNTRERIEASVYRSIIDPIYIGYEEVIESTLLKDFPEWYNFIISFRKAQSEYGENKGEITFIDPVTTSHITAISELLNDETIEIEEIMQGIFIRAKSKKYLDVLTEQLKNHYQNIRNPKELEIYNAFLECSKEYVLERGLR